MTFLNKACISTQLYDLNGWVYLSGINIGNSNTRTKQRRVNRSKTLDGGVYIDDLGYADGDRTLTLSADVDEDTEDRLFNILENHSLIWVSLHDGAFTAVMNSVSMNSTRAKINILIKEAA